MPPDDARTRTVEPGDRVVAGRYRIGRLLGRGGMGAVWAAHDDVLRRDVAVKEVLPSPLFSSAQQEEIRQRTLREARAAARITHPSVVRMYDVAEDGGRLWIVMELLDSRSLADVMTTSGPLTPAEAARVGFQVADAVQTAHRAGVLHRDIKPANVMLSETGRAVLTDFGIATVEEDPTLTVTGMLLGSPGYMSPERARGERPTAASDMWSLGATLFAAVEGSPPFRRDGQLQTLHAVINELPPQPTRGGPLTPLIERLLDRDPERRPTAEEAYRVLRQVNQEIADHGLRAAATRPARAGAAAVATRSDAPAAPAGRDRAPAVDHPDPGPPRPAAAAGPVPVIAPPPATDLVEEPATEVVGGSATGAAGAAVAGAAGAAVARAATGGATGTAAGAAAGTATGTAMEAAAEPARGTATGAATEAAEAAVVGQHPQPVTRQDTDPVVRPSTEPVPEAAGARPPRPPRGPGRDRRRTGTALVAAAAITIAATVAALLGLRSHDGGGQPRAGSPTSPASQAPARTTAPAATVTTRAPAATSASTSPTPQRSQAPAATTAARTTSGQGIPGDFRRYRDPTGFEVAVPRSWTRSVRGSSTFFSDPAGPGYLQVDQTRQPKPDALRDWQAQEAYAAGRFPGYHRIRLERVYYRGWNAADWEFTWRPSSGQLHVLNRNVRVNDSQAYALLWSMPAGQWASRWSDFQVIARTFQPA